MAESLGADNDPSELGSEPIVREEDQRASGDLSPGEIRPTDGRLGMAMAALETPSTTQWFYLKEEGGTTSRWLRVDPDGTQTEYGYHALLADPPEGFTSAQVMQSAAENAKLIPEFGARPVFEDSSSG